MSFFSAMPTSLPEPADDMDVEPLPSPIPDTDRHSYQEVVEEFLNTSEHSSEHVYYERMQ